MAKTINLEFEGKQYALEFTRKTIEAMERNGFRIQDINSKPVSTLPMLFAGAFLKNHRFVKNEVIEKLFNCITNKEELFAKLAEMYNESVETLFEEKEENEGNVTWGASW